MSDEHLKHDLRSRPDDQRGHIIGTCARCGETGASKDEFCPKASQADGLAWARELVEKGAWVMHLATRTVGQAKKLFVVGEYVSTVTGQPTLSDVLELSQGGAFVAKKEEFAQLTEQEVAFYEDLQAGLADAVLKLGAMGVQKGVRPQTAALLVGSALKVQAQELERRRAGRPA